MKARLFHSKRQGQSIIIIALIIVVLVGMVGLSVDVGNTYAQNRNAVRATDAAALAAMDKLIRGGDDTSIGKVIVASFKSNGITAQIDPTIAAQPGERDIKARYLDSNGNWIGSCYIGSCGSVPVNVTYIQINTTGTVDTYFARALGQMTLPVKAQAFAAQCTPVNGVYPIGMNAADLDDNGFKPPTDPSEMPYYIRYSDSTYQNLTGRRIYRKDNFDNPGSFSWLQWQTDPKAGSAVSTNNMLALDGNLDLGFQEVTPWPDPNSTPPDHYPLLPGQLSEGDWIAANTGSSSSNDIVAALDYHIQNRTILNLPIIDKTVGTGQTAAFHFNRMGAFYLRDYDKSGLQWFDFVYIGQANNKACLNTNVNQGLKGLGLQGQVYLNPRWTVDAQAGQPVAYNIVLDVSGSMSWDFNGYGTYDGSNHDNSYSVPNGVRGDVQCESPTNPNPLNLSYTDRCIGGRNSAWKNQNERRISVAKDAILKMINRMGPNDMVRVLAFSDSQSGNVSASAQWLNAVSGKATLQTIVTQAGAYGGDNYKTDGGTPGPQALQKASEMFLASNGYTPTICGGQSCKPVVIYLTDGVANIFLDGSYNEARDICANLSVAQAESTADPCQLGTTADNRRRPISAMVDVANNMKASMSKLEIYAVGLAQAPETGLPKVANDASYYFPASQPGYVDSILTSIQARATTAPCTAGGGYNWVNTVPSANTPGVVSPPLPSGVYGYVSIYDVNSANAKYVLPIQHDSASGLLSFRIAPPDPNNPASTGITPGTYEMTAYIYYKGPDGVTRQYDYFINASSLHEANRVPFSVTSAATLGSIVPINPIFLDMAAAKQVCATTP
jgi:hypothetical protein